MASGKAKIDPANLDLEISSRSFLALLFTQWLTSINDNVFRWLVIGIGKDYVKPGDIGWVLMAGTACFVAPYLLLAAPAGWLADRFCKRQVILACKIAEILVMTLGVIAIWIGNFNFLLFVVALMGAQSALFSPAKMGTIPELLGPDKMSKANGWFGLSTVTATVIGMGIGGWLADFTAPKGLTNLGVSATVLIGLAVAGTAISFFIRRVPAADPTKPFPFNAPLEAFRDLATLFSYRALFVVALGKVYFWSVGALAQLNIDAFSSESGGLGEIERIPLLVALITGVGVGSVLAGFLSGGRIELGMLWLGAIGISVSGILVSTVPNGFMDFGVTANTGYVLACVFLVMLGISAGIFDVPLSAYLQHKSPREKRGAILAASNFMLFAGILLASLTFYGMRFPFHDGSRLLVKQKHFHTLTPEEEFKMNQISGDFQSAWARIKTPDADDQPIALSEEEMPQLDQFLTGDTREFRKNLLGRLLWIDMRERRARDVSVIKTDYYKRYGYAAPETPTRAATANSATASLEPPAGSLDQRHLVKDIFEQSGKLPFLNSRQIFLVIGLTGIPVLIFVLMRLPQASLRFVGWNFLRFVYRIRVHDQPPAESGAVLVSNRCSHMDRILLAMCTARKVRWVTKDEQTTAGAWSKFWNEINISGSTARQQQAFVEARKALKRGEILVIFPEQQLSSSAQVNRFEDEYLKLIRLSPVPIVPTYIDELWGSRWTFGNGKGFCKSSRRLRKSVTIHFGQPLRYPDTIQELRQAVLALGASAVKDRSTPFVSPAAMFIRRCKQRKFMFKAGDLSGMELSGGNLLMRSLILRRLLKRHVLAADERFVGVLIPPSVGGVIVNTALALDKRVAINLNYTASSEVLNACIKQSGLKKILTTQKVLSKLDLKLDAEFVLLEGLKDKVTMADKLHAAINAFVKPAAFVEKSLGLNKTEPDDLMTLIFTSGSTGTPKGVMLSQRNIASNVVAIQNMIHLNRSDTIVGILPFFHSFGYTVTLWGSMGLDVAAAYHFTPLDGKQVGKLVRKFKGTCLLATPTFLRTYLRRATPEEFKSLSVVVAGAEKLPTELCDAFEEKFKVRPVEGYGTTELSPLVSVNVPPSRSPDPNLIDAREGSVGRPISNVAAKITDLETGAVLGVDQPGMLWIAGPNVMLGYMGRKDLTDEVIQDGWYKTGDVAKIDQDGFIIITGRQSRFSKIGGEMVPHILIEETLAKFIGADEEEGPKAVVTAVPDEKKGERLIVLHTQIDQSPQELIAKMKQAGLPGIYLPSVDAFVQVKEIPILGTGKLDLHGMKKAAMDFAMKQ
jgi:acyl-CoA synthetase (AMP-forming)/AMP-acid ligase II/1-acyl-sn-glycerol-3-phosphate acyltransferase/MFS family permease